MDRQLGKIHQLIQYVDYYHVVENISKV